MKKVALIILVTALVSVAGAAFGGGRHYCYDRCTWTHDGGGYCLHEAPRYYGMHYKPDLRLKMAEAEKLKASLHYYAMSGHPCDAATAHWMAAELGVVLSEIDAGCCYMR
jgi:hypothetical protein